MDHYIEQCWNCGAEIKKGEQFCNSDCKKHYADCTNDDCDHANVTHSEQE